MKLEPSENGFAIDAEDLAQLLDRPAGDLQKLMRAGVITARFERGEGEHMGRSRVTFFDEAWHVRLVVSDNGEVIEHTRVRAARRARKNSKQAPGAVMKDV